MGSRRTDKRAARAWVKNHLEEHHSGLSISSYIKEIVYGANDGIVTTFAVVAGFAGASGGEYIASVSVVAVLLFGLANLFADAASMGIGEFLSLRSSKDFYQSEKSKEHHEIIHNPENEHEETVNILITRGFDKNDAETLTRIFKKNPQYWLNFMMNEELEMPNIENENPAFTALATFCAFVIFGFIPLIPYVLFLTSPHVFVYSVTATTLALGLVGCMRWYVTQTSLIRSLLETILVGGTAASIAYVVGLFFR